MNRFYDPLYWARRSSGADFDGDIMAVTTIKEPKPEPKKLWLTTHNPYMSKDWKKELDKRIAKAFQVPENILSYDVNSLYPDGFIAARYGLDTSWIPKYENLSPKEILDEMEDMLLKQKCAERYFEYDEWMWEISEDIFHKLLVHGDMCWDPLRHRNILGITASPIYNKRNYIYLARKVKKVENMINDSFYDWLQKLLPRCRAFADGAGYDFCYATFSKFQQVNVRIMNPRNGKWQSFDFDYRNPADRNIDSAVRYVTDICMYSLRDTNKSCMDEIHHIDVNTLYPTRMIGIDLARPTLPRIKNVIFNDPATIVFWADGTKTVVKAQDEAFDPEKGLAMAISKKVMGNKGKYFDEFKKWLPEEEKIPECIECEYAGTYTGYPCCDCIGLHEEKPNHFVPKKPEPVEETPASTAEALYCRGKEVTAHICDNCKYCETCSAKEPCKSCAGVTGNLFGPDNFVPKESETIEFKLPVFDGETLQRAVDGLVELGRRAQTRAAEPVSAPAVDHQAMEDFFNDK